MALQASVLLDPSHHIYDSSLIPLPLTIPITGEDPPPRLSPNLGAHENVQPLHQEDGHSDDLNKNLVPEKRVSECFLSSNHPICDVFVETEVENAPSENAQKNELNIHIAEENRSNVRFSSENRSNVSDVAQVSMENWSDVCVSMENASKNTLNVRKGSATPACASLGAEGEKFTTVLLSDCSKETVIKPSECTNDEPNSQDFVISPEARKSYERNNEDFELEVSLDSGLALLKDDSNVTIQLQLASNVATGLDSNVSLDNVPIEGASNGVTLANQLMQDNVLNVPQTSECPWSLIHRRDVKLKGPEYGSVRENGEDMFEAVENKHAKNHVEIGVISFEEDKVANAEKEQSLIGRAIRKRFGRKYFFGTIDSYDSECNWYKVRYQDGDEEDLEKAEIRTLLLPLDYSPDPLSKKRKPPEGYTQERKSKNRVVDLRPCSSVKQLGLKKDVEGSSSKSKGIGFKYDAEKDYLGRRISPTATTFQEGILRYLQKRDNLGQSPVNKALSNKKEKRISKKEDYKVKSSTLKNAKSMCDDEGTGLSEVGSPVRKTISGNFYDGRVIKYNEETKYYTVLYEDGDQEVLEWKELKCILASSVTPTRKSRKSGDVQRASLIGMVARKKLGKRQYTGNVVSYNELTQRYKVKFEDGNEEDFEWNELKPILAAGQKPKCTANNLFANDVANKENHIITTEILKASSSQHCNKEMATTESNNTVSFQAGDLLIGSCTLKRFGRKMYAGNVIGYNKNRKLYKVKYEDGDQEELEWVELQPTLVRQCQQNSADFYADNVSKEVESGVKPTQRGSASMSTRGITDGVRRKERSKIGSLTKKKFGRKFYAGVVIGYDEETEIYMVRYEDGDEENLEWSDLEPTLVKHHNFGEANIDDVHEGDVSFIENKQQFSLMSKSSKAYKSSRTIDGETRFGLGNKLIGRSLMKEFSGKVYTGKVVAYDGKRKFYKVKYEDNDQEDLDWSELELVLVADDPVQKST